MLITIRSCSSSSPSQYIVAKPCGRCEPVLMNNPRAAVHTNGGAAPEQADGES